MGWLKTEYLKEVGKAIRSGEPSEPMSPFVTSTFLSDKGIAASIAARISESPLARHLHIKIDSSVEIRDVYASHAYATDPESFVLA